MKNSSLSVILILLVGCSEQPDATSSKVEPNRRIPDSQFVLGDWKVVDARRDGLDYPSELGGTTTFGVGSAIVKTNDGAETTYSVTFDQSKTPKQIDWALTQDGVTQTLYGLYDIQDEVLTTCSPSNFNMDRPTEIETTPGDGRWVFTLKRNDTSIQSQ